MEGCNYYGWIYCVDCLGQSKAQFIQYGRICPWGKSALQLYFMNYDIKSHIRIVISWRPFMAQRSFNTGIVPVDDNIQMHYQCSHSSNRTKIYQNRTKSRPLFSANSDQIRTSNIRLLPDSMFSALHNIHFMVEFTMTKTNFQR